MMKFNIYIQVSALKHIQCLNSVNCCGSVKRIKNMAFFKQMQNYILLFILFGLWSTWENLKYKIQIRVCSFLCIIIVLVGFSIAYIYKFYNFNSLSNTLANLLYIFIVITHLIIVVESIYQKDAQAKLIQNLSIVDHLFNIKSNVNISYHKDKCELFRKCSVLVLVLILINLIFILYTNFLSLYFNFYYVTMYSYSMMHLRLIQITFFVHLLRSRLILINVELKDIQNELRVQFNNVNQSDDCCARQDLISTNLSINDRLMNLKRIHGELYESCELINSTFGWSLLTNTMETFINFTANSYWGYMCRNNFGRLIIAITVLVPMTTTLGTLAYNCSSCFQHVSYFNIHLDFNQF